MAMVFLHQLAHWWLHNPCHFLLIRHPFAQAREAHLCCTNQEPRPHRNLLLCSIYNMPHPRPSMGRVNFFVVRTKYHRPFCHLRRPARHLCCCRGCNAKNCNDPNPSHSQSLRCWCHGFHVPDLRRLDVHRLLSINLVPIRQGRHTNSLWRQHNPTALIHGNPKHSGRRLHSEDRILCSGAAGYSDSLCHWRWSAVNAHTQLKP